MTLQDDKRALSHRIWQTVFEDSDAFARLYFNEVFSPHNTHLITTPNGRLALSHVQALPYRWAIGESVSVSAGYISGAATLPTERGKGYISTLMLAAHLNMLNRGDCLSFLLPASEELYRFYQERYQYTAIPTALTTRQFSEQAVHSWLPVPEDQYTKAYLRFATWQKQLSKHFQTPLHSYQQWQTVCKDLQLAGGGLFVHEGIDYYAYPNSVGEWLLRLKVPHKLQKEDTIPLGRVTDSTPHGMLRIIALHKLLQELPSLLPINIPVDVVDRHLPYNSGRYMRTRRGDVLFYRKARLVNPVEISYFSQQLLERVPALIYLLLE